MAKKVDGFTIRESELAKMLEISMDKLDAIVTFFDDDPDDEWELKENTHFIYLNKSLKERLFSKQGAYVIAKYMEDTQPQNFFARFKEFVTKHREKIRNAFINQKI